MNAGAASERLVFDCSLSRSRFDGSRMYSSGNCVEQEVSTSECARNAPQNGKSSGMPVKMLIAQEMSKEVDSGGNQPNLVAKLMGLDTFPSAEHDSSVYSQIAPSCQEPKNRFFSDIDRNASKGVRERWQKSWKSSSCKGKLGGSESDERMMDLVRQKFSEAKQLSTDGKLRQLKQFQDVIEVLSSNNDLFLKCLQEPNSVSSEQHSNWRSVPPSEQRRITVLFPSRISGIPNKDGCQVQKDAILSRVASEKISSGSSYSASLNHCENPSQPTRIVVLKPSLGKANGVVPTTSPHTELVKQPSETKNQELREDTNITGEQTYLSMLCRDESLTASFGNISEDSSLPPPIQTLYVDKLGSPCSSFSHSQTSYSPEVHEEAKKRLFVRWARMSSNEIFQEQRSPLRSTKSLGELLALSEAKMDAVSSESDGSCPEMDPRVPVVHQEGSIVEHPRNLMRSKSVPATPPKLGTKLDSDVAVMNYGGQHFYKEDAKLKSVKLSFRGLISSLFPLKNKGTLEKDCNSVSENETVSFPEEPFNANENCRLKLPDQESYAKLGSSNGSSYSLQSGEKFMLSHEDQHSIANRSISGGAMLSFDCRGSNLLGKSPAIGTIPRTISWDEPCRHKVTSHPAVERSITRSIYEELDWVLLAKTLLSVSGLQEVSYSNSYSERWHSPETPLDPLLRDKYICMQDKEMLHDAKKSHSLSTRNLVFDCVNAALLQITGPWLDFAQSNPEKDYAAENVSFPLGDKVLALLNSWFSRETRRMSDGCDNSVAVEVFVKDEVVSRRWTDKLLVEINDMNKDITRTLLEDLVNELVLEMACRVDEEAFS